MPKLDDRLIAVIRQIRSQTHIDIGSDHGGLLVSMIRSGRVGYGIAIENKRRPFENSSQALAGLSAEVRFGDGLKVTRLGEANSLSICGMGADNMLRILTAYPDRVPDHAVLQPNQKPEHIRRWAFNNGFHLVDEQITRGRRPYTILAFRRADDSRTRDPAYENVNQQAALLFGPHVLKRDNQQFNAQLLEEESYWSQFDRLEPGRSERLELIRELLTERGHTLLERCCLKVARQR